ncbi:sodium-coupled monocarboxylate transporter 1-like isoform X2 [Littorina saxatilis]|uniref:sodium-coupled monocarboxylate transporter 1-like isoform X2 n=1 Tax=Littorina saxatilis TaxID=31220 RepID=UPI0038B5E436
MAADYSINTGEVRTFGTVDYVLFVLTLLVSAGIGVFYAVWDRRNNTPQEFLLGGQKMQVVPVAMSLMVTFVSSLTLLGYPAEMYNYNTMFWWLVVSFLLSVGGAAFIFIPFFYRLGITSTFEYLEMRFSKPVRVIGSVMMIIQTLLYMAFLLYAPSLALNAVTGINLWGCVAGMGVVVTFYTTLGGMKAVLWTDTFQAGVIVAGLLAIIIRGITVQGGITRIWDIADNRSRILFDDFSVDPKTRHSVWSMVLGAGCFWLALYGVNQAQVQRCLSCPSVSKAKLAMLVSLPGLMVIVSLSCLLGVIMFVFYSDCDPIKFGLISKFDQLVPLYVMDTLGSLDGLPGIFVSAVVSGSLSSLSSGLNALSAVTFRDILEGSGWKSSSEFKSTVVSKLLVAGYGLGAVGLAWVVSQLGGILQALYVVFGILNGPVLGVFTLGMFFPWANAWGAVVGEIVSLAVLLWIGLGALLNQVTTPMNPTSTVACNWTAMGVSTTTVSSLNATAILAVNTTVAGDIAESEAGMLEPLYRMSYMWYTGLGMIIVWGVGLLVSFITGATDPSSLDPRLICPLVSKLLPCLPLSCRERCYCGVPHKQKSAARGRVSGTVMEEISKLFTHEDTVFAFDDVGSDEGKRLAEMAYRR